MNINKCKKTWKASDTTGAAYVGPIEVQGNDGEWHNFEVLELADRFLFGGACNVGFMESGYILKDDTESKDETLSEMLSDLENLYACGWASRLVYNDRV